MKLSQMKALLPTLNAVSFKLENGTMVPEHFHITEVGMVTKHFIDCGGTIRSEQKVSFQLWSSHDVDHRLSTSKLMKIIALSEEKLGIEDGVIEVEYQGDTIGKYHLLFDGTHFLLKSQSTACLAEDQCGITPPKPKIKISEFITKSNPCTPESGCC
jgi:hypothetical protein